MRSKLEYGCLVWNPFYIRYKTMIERVQRRFLKFLCFRIDGVYPERLMPYSNLTSRFNIVSLDLRRKQIAITFLYKILHNQIDANNLLSQINFLVPSFRSRSNRTFYCVRPRTNLYLKSPIYAMCNYFNQIGQNCDIHYDSLSYIIGVTTQFLGEDVI